MFYTARSIRDCGRMSPEQAVGDRHDRFLVALMAHHPRVPGAEGAVLLADRRQGDFDQGHAEPAVALARRPGLVLARALGAART